MDPAVLAGEPGSAQQLERGDDDLLALAQEPDERSADDAVGAGEPSELRGPRPSSS